MHRCATRSTRTSLTEFDRAGDFRSFSSAVSLHSHTHHSRESLGNVPEYIARVPVVGRRFLRELRTCLDQEGCAADYTNVWWHPPVSPRELFDAEIAQIEEHFGLDGLVSVTDHDNIAAGDELQLLFAERRAPISFEWTVPFADTFFHLGVHNLPSRVAPAWFERLRGITTGAASDSLGDVLADLDALCETLIVFNHPFWDLGDVGAQTHAQLSSAFLDVHGRRLHALELNGYRSWPENEYVLAVADERGLPIVSGGDRHGLEPNRLLNLSHATSFAEFAAEVRDGVSHVVVMPEYRQSLSARILTSAADVFRHRQARPRRRQCWTDRVSWESGDTVRTLSSRWPDGGSLWVRSAVAVFGALTNRLMLPLTRTALLAAEGTLARTAGPLDANRLPTPRVTHANGPA